MHMLELMTMDGTLTHVEEGSISELTKSVGGRVIRPDDSEYDGARRVWNEMIDRRPALIVQCAGTSDVIACVDLARRHRLMVTVRGGGHNVAGNAVNDGGMVIDLSLLRDVVVDRERMVTKVQGGAMLKNVDMATTPLGLATPLGVVPQTGVGGLTLHGGLGWLLRHHGTTADNLVAADIVTADGHVHHVSKKHESDLLWALRGGGGGFGVVTSFELKLHQVGPMVLVGLISYSLEDAQAVLMGFRDYMTHAPDELTANLQLWDLPPDISSTSTSSGPVLTITSCYSGSLEFGEKVMAPLRKLALPLDDLTRSMPFTDLQGITDSTAPEAQVAKRHYWKSIFVGDLDASMAELLKKAILERPSELSTMTVYALGGAFARAREEDGAFDNRDQPFLISIEADWIKGEDDRSNVDWARRTFEGLRKGAPARVYLNFPGFAEERDMAERTFGTSAQRLRDIKAKYDPTNLFRSHLGVRP